MELKRAAELVICSLLREQLSDLTFLPNKGGGDDVTPIWITAHLYKNGEILRATDLTKKQAIVVVTGGTSTTEPAFDDVIGSLFSGPPDFQTISNLAISKAVDEGTPLPPFATVQISGEKTMAQQDTDYLRGVLRWVTRADATNIVSHSQNFKRIYNAMISLGGGYDLMRGLMVHGIDVTGTSEYVDAARQARGDIINFTMGVSHH